MAKSVGQFVQWPTQSSEYTRLSAKAHPPMPRVVIIGNSGGGKSTLARKLAERRGLRYVEVDRLLWQDGWLLTPEEDYRRQHRDTIEQDDWVIDGLGRTDSISERIGRATEIILIDMPIWMHFWLAAKRQGEWAAGKLEHPPAGIARMPPTRDLFRTISEVDRDWMPNIRALCTEAEAQGKIVVRLTSLDAIDALAAMI